MKIAACLLVLCLLPLAAAADMGVAFVDSAWDGKTVPEGEQCGKFGGSGRSPELRVSGIPSTADSLMIDFSDRSFVAMDNGGHGKIAFSIEAGVGEIVVPRVDGHTLDLPAGFTVVAAHQAPNWDKAGAYLPPCSGGRGNGYYLTVRAVHQTDGEQEVLAEVELEMGKY